MSVYTFYYKYCRKGHFTYGESQIQSTYCRTCGQPFVDKCCNCGKQLNETFSSIVYTTSGVPIYRPVDPPRNCPNCGAAYPWNSRISRAIRWLRATSAKGWAEFKSLSPLHLILIILFLLFLIGVLTWNDLVEIIKTFVNHA